MAGVVTQEEDLLNHRVVSMWEECGIQFRSNLLLELGAQIVLHIHSYDHVAIIGHGLFDVTETSAEGEVKKYKAGSSEFGDYPRRLSIPKGVEHGFVLLENKGMPGEVLCIWPSE